MDAELKARWVKALRSGEYKQARYVLTDRSGGYCCLGVLCHLQGANFDKIEAEYGSLSLGLNPARYLGDIPPATLNVLTSMNDGRVPFPEIADYIEREL